VLIPVDVAVDKELMLELDVLRLVDVAVDKELMLELDVLRLVDVAVDRELMLELDVLRLVDVAVDSELMLDLAVLIPVDVDVDSVLVDVDKALMLDAAVETDVDSELILESWVPAAVDSDDIWLYWESMHEYALASDEGCVHASANALVGSVAKVTVADATRKVAGVEATHTAPQEAKSPCSSLLRLCKATRCRICTAGSKTRAAR